MSEKLRVSPFIRSSSMARRTRSRRLSEGETSLLKSSACLAASTEIRRFSIAIRSSGQLNAGKSRLMVGKKSLVMSGTERSVGPSFLLSSAARSRERRSRRKPVNSPSGRRKIHGIKNRTTSTARSGRSARRIAGTVIEGLPKNRQSSSLWCDQYSIKCYTMREREV